MPAEEKNTSQSVSLFNKDILYFFLKLIGLVVIWVCLNHFVFRPTRIPDKQLTGIISSGATSCINIFSPTSVKYTWKDNGAFAYIYKNGNPVFYIADDCNGLSLIAIYIGFIILLPYPVKRKIIFSVGGTLALIIANIFRCSILYWIIQRRPDLFDFNHHYVFTILMYIVIFFGWYLFTKRTKTNEKID